MILPRVEERAERALHVTLEEWSAASCPTGAAVAATGLDPEALSERLHPLVRVRPGWSEQLVFEARRKVGEARVGALSIEVVPKVGMNALLGAFAQASSVHIGLSQDRLGTSGATRELTLRQALAAGLVMQLEELVRGDVHRAYIARRERLQTLRGRPTFERLGDQPTPLGVPCHYVQLTRHTAPNALLTLGAEAASNILGRTALAGAARALWSTLHEIAPAPAGSLSAHAFSSARGALGHRYQPYRHALDLTQMLLLGGGPVTAVGDGGMSGWWVDMPSVFEHIVTLGVQRAGEQRGHHVAAQPRHVGAILDA
ncbi:MAG: hypothetical protein AAGI01_16075, partial [Myxococcota bacterium]